MCTMTTMPRIRKGLTTVVLALLLSGCGVPALIREAKDVSSPAVEGELALRGSHSPLVTWRPEECFAGEHEQFFGFILRANGSPIMLRAVVDPLDGPGLRVTGLEVEDLVILPSSCERLELVVAPSGWEVNEIQDLSGSLDVRCTTADGASVEGSLEVRHCH
jgi:hypothetical protein